MRSQRTKYWISLCLWYGVFVLYGSFRCHAQEVGMVQVVEPSLMAPKSRPLQWTSSLGKPYWYRLPRKMPKSGVTLLLMLHGTGSQHNWAFQAYAKNTRFRSADIILAPEGMSPGRGETFVFAENRIEEEQLLNLIRRFSRTFNVKKVLVYGHSRGAFFAHWFACKNAELIHGFVAHAGGSMPRNVDLTFAKKNLAVALIHGRADPKVSVDVAIRADKDYREAGFSQVKLVVVEGLTAKNGHGKLPKQVAEILAWLDENTKPNLERLLHAFDSERMKQDVRLDTLLHLVRRAKVAMKRRRGNKRTPFEERLARSVMQIDRLQAILAKESAKRWIDSSKKRDGLSFALLRRFYGHFRSLPPGIPANVVKRIRVDEKRVSKALRLLGTSWNEQTRVRCEKTLSRAFLAPSLAKLDHAYGVAINRDAAGLKVSKKLSITTRSDTTKSLEGRVDEIVNSLVVEYFLTEGR